MVVRASAISAIDRRPGAFRGTLSRISIKKRQSTIFEKMDG